MDRSPTREALEGLARPRCEAQVGKRREYASPKLRRLGSVAGMTHGGGSTGSEGITKKRG
jgi:hypothetical protein